MQAEWEFPDKLEFLFDPARYKVAHGGRGGSKSWGFARALLIQGWQKPLRILCTREVQKSIKDSVHKLLADQIVALGLGAHYEVLQTEIRGANGTEFIFAGLSSQTTESIKSFEGIDRCWCEEAQKITRRSWDILTPTIRKDGSEIWVSLNPELDTDETWQRFIDSPPANARVVEINYSDNPFLPQTLKDERAEFLRLVDAGKRTRDDYDNIWGGKTRAAVEGAIYHREVSAAKAGKRLCNVPYDPLLKVHTIWDLGWNDSMSILCVQRQASEIRIVRYIEGSHRTYADYVAELGTLGYRFGKDYIPHDGRAKSAESGRSPEMILKDLGRSVEIVDEIGVENGIKAARLLWPRCYFDKEHAGALFNRLGRYKRAINQTTNEPGAPLHDENSHGADGFRYLAVVADQLVNEDATPGNYYASFRRAG
jgi:phage terminase large subunit